MAFRHPYAKNGIFLFAFASPSLAEAEALSRKFNVKVAFIEPQWYRLSVGSPLLNLAEEFDLV